MAANVLIRKRLLDFRHMAGNAFSARAAGFVMRVFFNAAGVRTIGRFWTMAFETHDTCRLDQQSLIIGAMDVVATRALHAAVIHHALHEIIALHPILVSRSVREVRERGLAQLVLLQFPEALQFLSHVKAYRPVVVLTFDWVFVVAAPVNGTEYRYRSPEHNRDERG